MTKICHMKQVSLTIILLLSFTAARSQAVFSSLAESFTPVPAPVDRLYGSGQDAKRAHSVITLPPSHLIPLQLYTNFQCTEYIEAAYDDISEPFVLMMMNIPETALKLYSVMVGGWTEYSKIVLVLVDADGCVLDTLEAQVCWGPPAMYAKQARIDENYTITVYSIHAETDTPLPIDRTIPRFRGWREDEEFRVVNGQFVKSNLIRYKPQFYSYPDLTRDLWQGAEIPM